MQFYLLDVFAEKPFQGNQLAVFRNAGELSPAAMQAIARELHFAETAFIHSDEPSAAGAYRVRVFTPEYEIPFAGHPVLGTAWIIRHLVAPSPPETIKLALKVGNITVRAEGPKETLFFSQRDPFFGETYDPADVAFLLSLSPGDLDPRLPIRLVSTGLPFLLIPLRRLEAQRRIRLEAHTFQVWLGMRRLHKSNHPQGLTAAFFTFCPETYRSENQYNARMFILENNQIVEDAATGSANACLAAYLLRQDSEEKSLSLRVEQGCEIGRHSVIYLAGQRRGASYEVRVGGEVRLVAEGEWKG